MNNVKDASRLEMMIQQQVVERGIKDARVLTAMRSVPRDQFFPTDATAEAFSDRAWPIGHGQTISQPYMVALMSQRLNVHPEHKILEIGTGSGYQTAILSKLGGEVFTVERIKPLLDAAWERLMALGIRNTHFRHGDGSIGWAEMSPFDRILITAGAPQLPEAMLMEQLADGGVAVLPIGPQDEQMLVEVRKEQNQLVRQDVCPCRFVKLIGAQGWNAEAPETGR